MPAERHEAGPRRLLGVSDRIEVERLRMPNFDTTGDENRGSGRLFTGSNWDDVFVIPFRDLPNRYCGFLCVGRDGDLTKDVVYQRMSFQAGGHLPDAEGGLAMHPETLEACGEWDNRLLATENAFRMLQLQFKHFEQSTRPLPIAAWYYNYNTRHMPVRTRAAWHWVGDKQLVLWMPFPTVEVLNQAILLNAEIATNGPTRDDPESWRGYLSKQSPRDLVKRLFGSARHWTEVLATLVETQPDASLENLLLLLEIAGTDLDRTLKLCSSAARKRLQDLLQRTTKGGTVQINGVTFFERDDSWYCQIRGRQELVVDAVLRINEVIQQTQTKMTYYKGYVRHNKKKIPFCESKAVVDAHPFRWMDRLLVDNKAGSLCFNPSRSRIAIMIAMQFRQPTFVEAMDTVGWQHKEGRFILPQYAIELGGRIVEHDGQLFPHNVPAKLLDKPEELSGLDTAPLLADPQLANLIWAVTVPLLGNILAEACNEQTTGIGLHGAGAVAIGEAVAVALGCELLEINTKRDADVAAETEHRHNWPVFVKQTHRPRNGPFRVWLDEDRGRNHNALAALDWWQYALKSIAGAWTVVEAAQGVPLPEAAAQALRKFVPAYLKNLSERQMQIGVWHERSDSWLLDLAKDISKFLKPLDNNARRVVEALSQVRGYREHGNADAFADLVSELVSSRTVTVVQAGFEEPGCPALLQFEQGLLVPRIVLNEALAKHYLTPPDPLRLSAVLAHAGVLVEERIEGWLISEPWWRECHKRRRVLSAGQLKLHG